jgi:NitT/TauT family transport system permease protein
MRLINRRPGRPLSVLLMLLPFLAKVLAYTVASDLRRAANPATAKRAMLAALACSPPEARPG